MKIRKIAAIAFMVSLMTMIASGGVSRWNGAAGDGMWTNPANWNPAYDGPPSITNNTANWTGQAITLDAAGEVERWWSRHDSGDNLLIITTNGSLTSAGDVTLNEFSNSSVLSDLQVNGGSMTVSNDLSVAGQSSSQGGARLFLNSGTIDVLDNVKIGTAGQGGGVDGEMTVNGGSINVANHTILGGGNLATDEGTLNLYGGVYNESSLASTNPGSFQIGIGPGNGTVNLYGGMVINNHGLEMETGESNDVGTATINFAGGEWWQMGSSVDIQDQGTLNFQEGTFYWLGDRIADISALVASSNVTYELGLTNMLTENWDASWSNSITLDYGYWSKTYGTALYADYNDVSNGYTAVWSYNLSPDVAPPVSNDLVETHTFNNGSGDQVWTTAGNWDVGSAPTLEDTANHTANGATLVVDNTVAAYDLNVWNDSTATVAVVTYGDLTVSNDLTMASGGAVGVGRLIVDGGDVHVGHDLLCGQFGDSNRLGICELNSGNITVARDTAVGGQFNPVPGEMTINGGTYNINRYLAVGKSGAGTLTVNGGLMNCNDYINIGGNGSGTLTVNGGLLKSLRAFGPGTMWVGNNTSTSNNLVVLNGGKISISRLFLNTDGVGTARVEVNGGELEVFTQWNNNTFDIQYPGAEFFIGDGIVQRPMGGATPASIDIFRSAVTNGYITWDATTNSTMLTTNWNYAFTNETGSVLYIDDNDVRPNWCTMWAYKVPEPVDPPVMSLVMGTGSADVTADNLNLTKTYELQSKTSLSDPSWSGVATTSGVLQATWNVPTTSSAEFFQVEEL